MDGFTVTRETTVHTSTGSSPARWTWDPQEPITAHLEIDLPDDLPDGVRDVVAVGRTMLWRVLAGQQIDQPPNPESWVWVDVMAGRRVLWAVLAPHADRDVAGPRASARKLRLWTSTVSAMAFLKATYEAMPPCPHAGMCPGLHVCQESAQAREWLVAQLATEPTP